MLGGGVLTPVRSPVTIAISNHPTCPPGLHLSVALTDEQSSILIIDNLWCYRQVGEIVYTQVRSCY